MLRGKNKTQSKEKKTSIITILRDGIDFRIIG